MLAFQVPASVKAGSLEPSQLPFKRLFPDPVDQNNPAVALDSPRGIVIGGPGPLMYVADPGPPFASKPQILVADPTPPYAVRGALRNGRVCKPRMRFCITEITCLVASGQ